MIQRDEIWKAIEPLVRRLVRSTAISMPDLGGNGILLNHAGAFTYYVNDDTGLAGAVGAAVDGDHLTVPMCAAGSYTASIELEAGVVLTGVSRTAVVFSGKITLGANAGVESISVIRALGSGEVVGIEGPTSGVCQVVNCTVKCTAGGSALAMGIRSNNGGTIEVWASSLEGVSASGDGYGGGATTSGTLRHYGGRSVGSTTPYLEPA